MDRAVQDLLVLLLDRFALLVESRSDVDSAIALMKKCGVEALLLPEEHPEFVPSITPSPIVTLTIMWSNFTSS
jgi:hypothetical protein